MPFTVENLPAAWVERVNNMTEAERDIEAARIPYLALRGFKSRHASYIRKATKPNPDDLLNWAKRGSSYEDNYRRNGTDTNGNEFATRQAYVRRLMGKIWYLNSLKSVPELDPFAEFRQAFGDLLTEFLGERVRIGKTVTNSDVYFESDSFKIELPDYERRLRRNRQLLSRSGRRR